MIQKNSMASDRDYRIWHQPPCGCEEDGAVSAYELDRMAPDFYVHPSHYMGRETADQESLAALLAVRDNPEALVVVYRGVWRNDGSVARIEHGNWVTLSRRYAEKHIVDELGELDGTVLAAEIRTAHLWWDGNSINEFGYGGPTVECVSEAEAERNGSPPAEGCRTWLCSHEGWSTAIRSIARTSAFSTASE
jgi:hypothetical protein